MFKFITDVRSSSGTKFNYGVMNVKTGKCFGFYTLDDSFEHDLKHIINNLNKGTCWRPTSYTELSTEFSTLSDLKQILPELFI